MEDDNINPRLRFDAFTGGIKNGGLRSKYTINLIVCYLIANINGKITRENIVNTMVEGEIANYFEITSSIAMQIDHGVVVENEDGSLELADRYKDNVDLIEQDLPYTIRKRSIKLCQKLIAKETFERENKVDVVPLEKGFNVILRVSDVDTDFMELKLFASTIEQVEMIKDFFITNPIRVYENLIESIFTNDDE